MSTVILERAFDPPLTDALFNEMNGRLGPCLERSNIKWIRSHRSLDRTRLLCVFEAPDADTVRDALRQARVAHERVWPGDILEP